jgi:hypothetical protein
MTEERHIKTDDARSGSTPHIVRYVLTISLALAVLVMIGVLIWGTPEKEAAMNLSPAPHAAMANGESG